MPPAFLATIPEKERGIQLQPGLRGRNRAPKKGEKGGTKKRRCCGCRISSLRGVAGAWEIGVELEEGLSSSGLSEGEREKKKGKICRDGRKKREKKSSVFYYHFIPPRRGKNEKNKRLVFSKERGRQHGDKAEKKYIFFDHSLASSVKEKKKGERKVALG